MTSEFPITIVVAIVVDLDDISPCKGNSMFKENFPSDGGLSNISTVKGDGTAGCNIRDIVRKSKMLADSPIHGEPSTGGVSSQ